jgi:hypothetical protein
MDTLLSNLLTGFRPAARKFERGKRAQKLPYALARLCADAFDFGKVAVEFSALEIGYNFVVFHGYLN